jgi:hypothetical protein
LTVKQKQKQNLKSNKEKTTHQVQEDLYRLLADFLPETLESSKQLDSVSKMLGEKTTILYPASNHSQRGKY